MICIGSEKVVFLGFERCVSMADKLNLTLFALQIALVVIAVLVLLWALDHAIMAFKCYRLRRLNEAVIMATALEKANPECS